MSVVTGEVLIEGVLASGALQTSGSSVDPASIVDASSPERAIAAFAIVSVLGGLLLWRYEPFVDRAITASMASPLRSLAYGAAAHAVIAFAGVYLTSQLARLDIFGQSGGALGLAVGVLVVLLAGSLGFVVVGSAVVEFGWERQRWYGLAVGALTAGVAGWLGPVAGGLLWFVVVSMGIGGPARNWLHADQPWER